jgi:hypothetical protein
MPDNILAVSLAAPHTDILGSYTVLSVHWEKPIKTAISVTRPKPEPSG